jgi:uncharacterized RDD family membrane protein YckC
MTNVYEAPVAQVALPSQESSTHYMGFWTRCAATIIDNIWIALVLLLIVAVAGTLLPHSSLSPIGAGSTLQLLLPAILVISLWVRYASTPGKMVFSGKIVDADTLQPVTGGRLVLRYVGYLVSILPLGLGFLWVAWDSRKQGFHDKIAGTVVVIDHH